MSTPVKTQEIRFGDNVPEGQVFDKYMILNGTEVSIDGTVNGDVLAYGRSITVNGKVNGSLVVFGDSININGGVINNLLVGAVKIELDPGSKPLSGFQSYPAQRDQERGNHIDFEKHEVCSH